MADTNDRNYGSEQDLFDETAPRSIFAATWFRAVLVLIVLGVVGAVAVPYILDAMNGPKPGATAKLPTPMPPPSKAPLPQPPVAVTPSAPSTPPGPAAVTPASPPTAVSPPPAPATPSAPPAPVAVTPVPTAATPTDKPGATDKPSATKDATVAATTPRETPKIEATKPSAAAMAAKPAKPAASRQWFVQVGAFKDPATAKKVAAKLRDENYTVDESSRSRPAATVAKATTTTPTTSSGGDQYDVIITGQSADEMNRRLESKGLAAEAVGNGVVVKPSLPLRDAVALSKDLAVDGLKVQVRRVGGDAPATSKSRAAATASSATGEELHRVSVGGFADRTTAMAALTELEAKGYKPFLTRR